MIRTFLLVCLGASILVGSLAPEVTGSDGTVDPRLKNVLADWQRRQNWFDAVEYKVSGKHVIPQGSYSDAFKGLEEVMGLPLDKFIPPKKVEGAVSFTILIDFGKGRERRSIHDQLFEIATGKLTEMEMQDTFDGTEMKCLIPKEKNPGGQIGVTQPELTSVKGNMKNGQFLSSYYPVFFAHGRIYTALEPILPDKLRNKPNPNNLFVHGTDVYKDHQCLIIRTLPVGPDLTPPPFFEYWVDIDRENAIVRYLSYAGKVAHEEISIDYVKSEGHWLPTTWRWTVLHGGKPLYFDEMIVQKITFNPSVKDKDFELPPVKPGMLIEERVDLPTSDPIKTPESKIWIYRIDDKGKRIPIPRSISPER